MFFRAAEATLYAKIEGTYGVIAAPSVAADVLRVFDLSIKALEAEVQEDEVAQDSWGNSEIFHVGQHVSIEFSQYLTGSGDAGTEPSWGLAYKIAGNAVTLTADTDATYNPISVDGDSATMFANIGGNRHPITGVRGTVTGHLDAKKRPYLKFKGLGLFNTPVDKTTINPDLTGIVHPVTVGQEWTTCTLHGETVNMVSYMFDQGNDYKYMEVTGYKGIDIDDRKPKSELVIMAPAVTTQDWFSVALAGIAGALIIEHGTGDGNGNHIRIEEQRVQLNKPDYVKVDGKWALKIGLHVLPGEDTAGNDERLIIVS
ncbi:MAG: hypothetical protein R3332_08315 [Pseudohongiellaceae bacterium]|nr:hypothetical protein [Pseudohongiellaceae bacterium]